MVNTNSSLKAISRVWIELWDWPGLLTLDPGYHLFEADYGDIFLKITFVTPVLTRLL